DLVEVGVEMMRQERREQVKGPAKAAVERRLLDILLPPRPKMPRGSDPASAAREADEQASYERSRETLRRNLESGALEERVVEIEVATSPAAAFKMFGPSGPEEMDVNLKEMLPGLFQSRSRVRKLTVAEAREVLQRE